MWSRALLSVALLVNIGAVRAEDGSEEHDAREGEQLTLVCRFDPVAHLPNITYYWVRNTVTDYENAAIGELTLQTNYRLNYEPSKGRYDLIITNVSYDRDNAKFECRVRQGGTGKLVHTQAHRLVVLTAPGPPALTPSDIVQAQEGRETKLTCTSVGGSPAPTIKWYREGSSFPLPAELVHGPTRDVPSTATYTLIPEREDDGAYFRCEVSNRALPEGSQLEAHLSLSVQYFPRIEITHANPLRVEIGGTATLECKVDAKPTAKTVGWIRDGQYVSHSLSYTIDKVTAQDAGNYTCSADNSLSRPGEKTVYLDVLYPPSVTVESKTYETEEGANVEIPCEVSANPEPVTVEWGLADKPDFLQKGNTLLLRRVTADMAGTYECRATNVIAASASKAVERSSSASVAVLVRHRPGRARIHPERPVVQEGGKVTLKCSAHPPGWPEPQYRWYRDGAGDPNAAVLATGGELTVASAHLGSEGVYSCQATNELGHGEPATATLEVHQPPHFQIKLPLHMSKRSGVQDFSVSCSAQGKPRPSIKWLKNKAEITPDANLYEVKTDYMDNGNSVFNVHSTLKFNGKARPKYNDLLPEDRGLYMCVFENEVKKLDSTMSLRIEHPPIVIKQEPKVAYDLMENAQLSCRILSFPKPEIRWYYGTSTQPIQASAEGHYDVRTSSDHNDSYYSVLVVKSVSPQDYGDYHCKVTNSLGSISPVTRLQPKGPPETPKALSVDKIGASYVTLGWEAGFNGGLPSTKYFVLARQGRPRQDARCGREPAAPNWAEHDCGTANPCNVTELTQHNSYFFKVKALNNKGESSLSEELEVSTKVDEIPAPERVTYDPTTKTVIFTAPPSCLPLIAMAEGLGPVGGWQLMETIPLSLSGVSPTPQEAVLKAPERRASVGRPAAPLLDEFNPRLRIRICLQPMQDICSNYTEAEIGTAYPKSASFSSDKLVIMVAAVVVALVLGLIFVFCWIRCRANAKDSSNDYDRSQKQMQMSPQNQAPPPYYPSSGMENKALEHSMDSPLDDSKTLYATQGGYAYHMPPHPHTSPHTPQNMPPVEWLQGGMMYKEASYPNSNHGGSVNSQDSLWQMKAAPAQGAATPQPLGTDPNNYGYDPTLHGGYRILNDYEAYPAHAPSGDYKLLAGSQAPSRQDYCANPYASVHKPKKRMDQHIDSTYHEVSGLPEAFGSEPGDGEPPLPTHGYEESESGYSATNPRGRRVIREIIV